ncbi:fatty acid desaturase [Bradyrhizobium sp. USDA 4524]|uniref:fatty acid desaturase n=1 Tax=unclassified Bradyrhizobium TaxID=2631580 RepID=UPI00209DD60E|nr:MULTISPECIES: fatty acid desaturase [unclassified Bradyrhizobium]MCP1838650.1 fatty acid desaturase [Bradyrhizobium sp. USDA 4538]MCP1899216.1 fatty acid desaturase [Bradyrhizobium sp. USDA 4537]MCP1986672.1 fatty acid desaturase [Bradyrhizobium sp. USDA 4539]
MVPDSNRLQGVSASGDLEGFESPEAAPAPAFKAEPWVPPSLVGVIIEKKKMKSLMRRSDARPLLQLFLCVSSIALYGWLYYLSWGTRWVIPTIILFGGTLSLFAYSASHECAHGTAFKTRWLNEVVFWFSSLIYGQEPMYRRYSHAEHHTYTWFWEKDAQMSFTVRQKVDLWTYIRWYLGIEYRFVFVAVRNAFGKFSEKTRRFTPASELWPMRRNSIVFVTVWVALAALSIYFQSMLVVWFYVIPKIVGDVISRSFVATQHFEMGEDDLDLTHSTRSIKNNWFYGLYYWNMSYHVEHHFAPTVPFHKLPALNAEVKTRLPEPRGVIPLTIDIYKAMRNRHLSIETDALEVPAPH